MTDGNNNSPASLWTSRVTGYSQSTSGVWFFHVEFRSTTDAFTSYTVKRRYSDFQKLYEKIIPLVPFAEIPAFPEKCSLWRYFSGLSTQALAERQVIFHELLEYIEDNAVLRNSKFYSKFRGKPPHAATKGYTSLMEYSCPNWVTSVRDVVKKSQKKTSSKGKRKNKHENRRRRVTLTSNQQNEAAAIAPMITESMLIDRFSAPGAAPELTFLERQSNSRKLETQIPSPRASQTSEDLAFRAALCV